MGQGFLNLKQMNINPQTLENKLVAELDKIQTDLKDEQYNGKSEFYYYTHEAMPQRLSSLKWAASVLLADVLHPQWINSFLRDIEKINY